MSESLFHELALKSRLHEFGRHWSVRLGPRPARADDPAAQFIEELVATAVEQGPPPTELAVAVVDAIRTGRFMVVTDVDLVTAATAARAAEIGGSNPVLPVG